MLYLKKYYIKNNIIFKMSERKLVFHHHKSLRKFTDKRKQYLIEQVKRLKLLPQPEQRTPEWYAMRDGMISASDAGTVIGENPYQQPQSVLLKKCGESDNFKGGGSAIQWGVKYENVAKQIYEHRNETVVHEFGCIKHPTIDFLGASPDGITDDGIMLEIKCPSTRVIDGIIPKYYYCQVQMQLEVCELDRCDFLECLLKEFENEDDYLNYDYRFHNEKGVVVEFFKPWDKSKRYEYSPIGISGSALEDWKKSMMSFYDGRPEEGYIFDSFSYWYLEEVSCIPIYRNQEWFHSVYPILDKCWSDILYYRGLENGLETLKSDILIMRDIKKSEKNDAKEQAKAEKKEAKEASKMTAKSEKKITGSKRTKKDSIDVTMLNFVETVAEPKVKSISLDDNYDDISFDTSISHFTEEPDIMNKDIKSSNNFDEDYELNPSISHFSE